MFFGGLLLSAMTLVGCTDEYDDWAEPQSNPQEEAAAALPGYTATGVGAIDLGTVTADSVQVLTLSTVTLPEGATVGNTRVEVLPADGSSAAATTINVGNNGNMAVADLQAAIEGYYGKQVLARTFNGHVYSNIIIGGQAFLVDAGTITITATPALVFADYYYIIGALNGWTITSTDLPMFKEGEGVFSYTTVFATGNEEIKFTADYNLGSWAGAYGLGNAVSATSGTLTDADGAGNLKAPTSDECYTVTVNINPDVMTYEWTKIEPAPKTYGTIGVIGDFNSWGDDVDMTEVAPHNWYVEVELKQGGLKFRADDAWTDQWAGANNDVSSSNYGTAEFNGGDMKVPDGKYRIYFNDITAQYIFIPAE